MEVPYEILPLFCRSDTLDLRRLARITGTTLTVEGLDHLPRGISFIAMRELAGSWFTRVPLERIGTLSGQEDPCWSGS